MKHCLFSLPISPLSSNPFLCHLLVFKTPSNRDVNMSHEETMPVPVMGRQLGLALRVTPLVTVLTASDAELLTSGKKITS